MGTVIYANFRSDEPLQNALALLTQASDIANKDVPAVPKTVNQHARRFRRHNDLVVRVKPLAPTGRAGATRFFKHRTKTTATFAAKAQMPQTTRNTRMASALLMAGEQKRTTVPVVQALDIFYARVIRNEAMRNRLAAIKLAGMLRQRFNENMLDMADGYIETERLVTAKGRKFANLAYT